MEGRMRGGNSSEASPIPPVPIPLVLDDTPMGDVEAEALVDINEDIVRHSAARTIFQQPRGDDDTLNSTRSLYDSDVVYFYIHGRRYCGEYNMPNDEDEQTRLQILHEVYLRLFDYKLTSVPLHNPKKILDIGTGTGEWAMAMGDEYPNAEVIGTDIAKIQPTAVPLNVFFEIDDAELEGGWTWPEDEFDMIHIRSMVGAFKNWRYIYEEAYRHLKPGGWIEVLDFDDHKIFLTYFDEKSGVFDWLKALRTAAAMSGRPRSVAHLEPENLTELGFVEVSTLEKVIPMGVWPDDKEEQRVGKHFLIAQLNGIEALSLRPLTEQLGWDVNEVSRMGRVVTDRVMEVAKDAERAKGLGFRVKILLGRKPLPGEEDDEREQDASSEGDSGRTMTMTMEDVNGQPVNHGTGDTS